MKTAFTMVALMLFTLVFGQISHDLFRTYQVHYPKRANWHIAVFPIDFTDIPTQHRVLSLQKNKWQEVLFSAIIRNGSVI